MEHPEFNKLLRTIKFYISDTGGHLRNVSSVTSNKTIKEISSYHPDIASGGYWLPSNCEPSQKVTIVFPYRDREQHLIFVLDKLIPFLKLQKIAFRIVVVEQV